MSTFLILIVEDDRDFDDSLVDVAEIEGFDVLLAKTACESYALAADKTISLAFIDIKLKDSDGITVARELRELQPGMDIIYMTGYTREKIQSDYGLPPESRILYKPFKIDQFISIIHSLKKQ